MFQKFIAHAHALMSARNQSGNVGNDKIFIVCILHDAQMRRKRGEGVIGNLGFGCGNTGDKGRFARIGETDNAYIGQNFSSSLSVNSSPVHSFLGKAGRLMRGGRQVRITLAADAAACGDVRLSCF